MAVMLVTPARRLTPRKPSQEHPSPRPEAPAQPNAGSGVLVTMSGPAAEAMATRRGLALAAAVVTVWALLAAAAWGAGPLFLLRPPITRRSSGFHEFKGDDCSHALAQGSWTDTFQSVQCTSATRLSFATCSDTPQRHWEFSGAAHSCGARRMAAAHARALLRGQRLVFAGDSIARNLYGATLRLLGQPGQDIVVGHADFQHELEGGISLQFFWAPYPENLTALLGQTSVHGGSSSSSGGSSTRQHEQPEPAAEAAAVAEQEGKQQQQQQDGAGAAAGEEGAGKEGPQGGQGQPQEEQGQGQPGELQAVVEGQAEGGDELPALAEGEAKGHQAEEGAAQQQQQGEQAAEQQPEADPEPEQAGGESSGQRRQQRRLRGEQQQQQQRALQGEGQQAPALAVFSSTLWHLLHFTEAADFQQKMEQLKAAAAGYAAAAAAAAQQGGSGGGGPPRLLLASSTETFPNRMRTQQKQRNMTPANVDAYNAAMEQAGLLAPSGPFALLDLFPLTRSCGEECTIDGIHSLPVVYDAALQLLLNVAVAEQGAGAQAGEAEGAGAGAEAPGQRRRHQLRRALRDGQSPAR